VETITLGQNGPQLNLCIGTWAWGDKLFWNYGRITAPISSRKPLVALEAGTTFFDTAEVYGFGLSEDLLGQFMQQSDQPVQIATNLVPPWRFTASRFRCFNSEPETLTSGTGLPLPGALAFQLLYEPRNADERSCRRGEARQVNLWVSATTQPNSAVPQLLAARGVWR